MIKQEHEETSFFNSEVTPKDNISKDTVNHLMYYIIHNVLRWKKHKRD